VTKPRHLQAFGTTALLATGGFMLMPFGSAFTVHNLGIAIERLPLIYLITGFCTIFTGPLIGRASDRIGKYKTFVFGTALGVAVVILYTHLGTTPLPVVVLVNAAMFVGIFSRMIPAQALMSAIPEPRERGAFMSVSSSLQQISGGIASVLAGLIVSEGPGGAIVHFEQLGYVVAGSSLVTLFMMNRIRKLVPEAAGAPPVVMTAPAIPEI
jgi:predicted MFS family arabinose efflux permease